MLIMGDNIYARDRKELTETAFPTKGTSIGTFMRSKLRMGLIKKQYFRVTSEIIKDLLERWDTY